MERVTYSIDRRDAITRIGNAWQSFAASNDTPGLGGNVIGRSIWDYVSDETTRQVYRDLIARVRAGRTVSFTYRCDSPGLRRFMRMTMRPAAEDGVSFESTVERAEARPPVALLEPGRAMSSAMIVRVCSWCKRAHADGAWHEVEAAVEKLGLFRGGPMPGLTHGMCEACYARVTADDEF